MSRQMLVAILYSQVRSDARPSNSSACCHAHHGLLHRVLGLGVRTRVAVAVPHQLAAERLGLGLEGELSRHGTSLASAGDAAGRQRRADRSRAAYSSASPSAYLARARRTRAGGSRLVRGTTVDGLDA